MSQKNNYVAAVDIGTTKIVTINILCRNMIYKMSLIDFSCGFISSAIAYSPIVGLIVIPILSAAPGIIVYEKPTEGKIRSRC